ncbi:hypothetical protein K504DRAFT_467821 [Pleomassaria siparia CBS 279.74]|uniref:BTB domain-containing protein n=1 Tax=Pleomassaria siparia CBS 279.74 TaxID=1314801 RepID=A0A6G1K875_9PLEO|nr:hypothetical protein K504DRAFT_467821 [Pleomassaria siparia CBS 279.74]
MDSQVGRDFTIITSNCVEFKIHSAMIVGGPRQLEDYVFSRGATGQNPRSSVTLPAHMIPVCVDALVHFLYQSAYSFENGSVSTYRHATVVPENVDPIADAIEAGMNNLKFHMHMYALGEELEYSDLKAVAHGHLVGIVMQKGALMIGPLKNFVDLAYGYLPYDRRVCRDDDHAIRNLAVVSVIFHELQIWEKEHRAEFMDSVRDCDQFLTDMDRIKKRYKHILMAHPKPTARLAHNHGKEAPITRRSSRAAMVKRWSERKQGLVVAGNGDGGNNDDMDVAMGDEE